MAFSGEFYQPSGLAPLQVTNCVIDGGTSGKAGVNPFQRRGLAGHHRAFAKLQQIP
jgi:hypothetical protein